MRKVIKKRRDQPRIIRCLRMGADERVRRELGASASNRLSGVTTHRPRFLNNVVHVLSYLIANFSVSKVPEK
jgi:hypothetical protein